MRPATTQGFYLHHLPHYALLSSAFQGANVLQLGGGGYTAQYAFHLGAKVICGLPSEDDVARNQPIFRGPGLQFEVIKPPTLPFEDDQFDVVMGLEVVADMADIDAFISEIKRVLAPNGFALITLPNFQRDDFQEVMGEGARSIPLRSPADVYTAATEHFESVRLMTQSPFLGYMLAEVADDGQTRPFDLNYDLMNAQPEGVLYYTFLVSDLELVLETDQLIQVPWAHLVDRLQEGLRTFHRALERKNNALLELRDEMSLLHQESDTLTRRTRSAEAKSEALTEVGKAAVESLSEHADVDLQALSLSLQTALNHEQADDTPLPAAQTTEPTSGPSFGISADEARLLFAGLQGDDIAEDLEALTHPSEEAAPLDILPPAPSSVFAPAPVEPGDPIFQEDLTPFILPGPVPLSSQLRSELHRVRDALHTQAAELGALTNWQQHLLALLDATRREVHAHVGELQAWDATDPLTQQWVHFSTLLSDLLEEAGVEPSALPTPDDDAPPDEPLTRKLRTERDDLQAALHTAQSVHAQLDAELDTARALERTLRDELETAVETEANLDRALALLREEGAQTDDTLAALHQDLRKAKTEVTTLDSDRVALQAELRALRAAMSANRTLSEGVTDFDFDGDEEITTEAMVRLHARLANLDADLQTAQRERKDLERELQESSETIAGLEEQLNTARSESVDLTEELEDLRGQLEALEQTQQASREETDSQAQLIEDLQVQLLDGQKAESRLSTGRDQLSDDLEAAQVELETLRQRLETREAEFDTERTSLSERLDLAEGQFANQGLVDSEQKALLSASLEEKSQALTSAQASVESLETELTHLKSTQEQALTDQLSAMETERAEHEAALALIEAQHEAGLSKMSSELQSAQEGLLASTDRLEAMERRVSGKAALDTDFPDAPADLRARMVELNEREVQLQGTLHERESELSELKDEIKRAWSHALAGSHVKVAEEDDIPEATLEVLGDDPMENFEDRIQELVGEIEKRDGEIERLHQALELKAGQGRSLQEVVERQRIELRTARLKVRQILEAVSGSPAPQAAAPNNADQA